MHTLKLLRDPVHFTGIRIEHGGNIREFQGYKKSKLTPISVLGRASTKVVDGKFPFIIKVIFSQMWEIKWKLKS